MVIENLMHPCLSLQGEISVNKYSTDIFPIQEEPNQECAYRVIDLELRFGIGYSESQGALGVTGIE